MRNTQKLLVRKGAKLGIKFALEITPYSSVGGNQFGKEYPSDYTGDGPEEWIRALPLLPPGVSIAHLDLPRKHLMSQGRSAQNPPVTKIDSPNKINPLLFTTILQINLNQTFKAFNSLVQHWRYLESI